MTPQEHYDEAERLIKRGKNLLAASRQPDAAGSAIRARWAQDARDLFAEAAAHGALAGSGSES